MALTARQVELAGTGKGNALGPGRHPDVPGLYLEVASAKQKSFMGRYTLNGKETWRGCGSATKDPAHALKRARERHAENQRLVADDIDPKDFRKAQRTAAEVEAVKQVTWRAFSDNYILIHESEWSNAEHRRQWRTTLRDWVHPHIGNLPIQEIDASLAMRIFQQPANGSTFWLSRNVTARRVRARCELIWDAAKAQKLCGENPFDWKTLRHLLPAKTKMPVKHFKSIPYTTIPAFMKVLRERKSRSARMLEFVVLTASRIGPVALARGREFHLDAGRWLAPAEHMKGRREHLTMLSKRAVDIVRELHPNGLAPDDLVFGISRGGLLKMIVLSGYGDFTIHGCRASFKTWADETTGFKDAVSEVALAHAQGDRVKQAYARGQFERARVEMMEAWARHCASTPVDTSNTVVHAQFGGQRP
jgi:integrase